MKEGRIKTVGISYKTGHLTVKAVRQNKEEKGKFNYICMSKKRDLYK